MGPAEADIDFDIIKNDNDTFTVKYTPPGPGRYTIMVVFADQVEQHMHKCMSRYPFYKSKMHSIIFRPKNTFKANNAIEKKLFLNLNHVCC